MQELPDLHISALLAHACCDGRLHPHLMTKGTEERLELRDSPVVRLCRSSHRLTAVARMGRMSLKTRKENSCAVCPRFVEVSFFIDAVFYCTF